MYRTMMKIISWVEKVSKEEVPARVTTSRNFGDMSDIEERKCWTYIKAIKLSLKALLRAKSQKIDQIYVEFT